MCVHSVHKYKQCVCKDLAINRHTAFILHALVGQRGAVAGAGTGHGQRWVGRGEEEEEGGVRQMAPSCCLPNWVDAGTGAVDVASRRVMATKSLPPANVAAKTDV